MLSDEDAKILWITDEIEKRLASGCAPEGIAVIAPTNERLRGLRDRLAEMGIPVEYFRDNPGAGIRFARRAVKLITPHSAKGLGFPHVILLLDRSKGAGPPEDVERKLSFVAMSRAGISLCVVTSAQNPHPIARELLKAGQAELVVPD